MDKLVLGQRLDFLAKTLSEEVGNCNRSPLSVQTILVPDGLMKSWLALELAKFSPSLGIAGCKILTFQEGILSHFLGHPSFGELFLSIYQEIASLSDPVLTQYLEKSKTRQIDLSEHLTTLFFAYGELFPDIFSSKKNMGLQSELIERLFLKGPFRLPIQTLKNTDPFTSKLHLFGIDFLPPCYWEYLFRFESLSIYQFSPCLHFWEDVCTDWEKRRFSKKLTRKGASDELFKELSSYIVDAPPLLANLGKLGRETLKIIDSFEFETDENYETSAPCNLLQKAQSLLLNMEAKDVGKWEVDSSISVSLTGASLFNEVENLCLEIRALVKKGVPFSEILVLAPDLNTYSPMIELIFSNFKIPYRIIGLEIGSKSLFLQGLFRLIAALSAPLNKEDLISLFETPTFYRKAGFDELALTLAREWISRALEDLPSLLDSLITFSIDRPGSIEMGDLERLELFIETFRALQRWRIEAAEKTIFDWGLFLEKIGDEFLKSDPLDEADSLASQFFYDIIKELKGSQKLFGDKKFTLEPILRLLKRPIKSQIHANSLHAVTIAPFTEGSLISKKALFMIGMDEESYPRMNFSSSLDLLKSGSTGYIPDSFDRDRYLFLRALYVPKDYLRISFGHISKEEGKPIGPSPLVQEFLDFMDRAFSLEGNPLSATLTKVALPSISSFQKVDSISFGTSLVKEELPLEISISDLTSLAKNPWKFFLRKKLGIFLENREDPSVPLQKAILLREALIQPLKIAVGKHREELPKGLFGEALIADTDLNLLEWKKEMDEWGIKELFTARFYESCREKKGVGRDFEFPSIKVSLGDGKVVKITGELKHLSSGGLLYLGKDDFESLLKIWPEWLIASITMGTSQIFCLKTGKIKTLQDPEKWLQKYLLYYFSALSSPSPLLPEWGDALLRKGVESLEKKMETFFSDKSFGFQDPIFEWIGERGTLPTAVETEAEWGEFLRDCFGGFSQVFEKKSSYAEI